MNIYLRELKASKKSLILWCIGMFVMIASGMSKFVAYRASSEQSLNELISKMPKALQTMFGAGSVDLSKAIGFYVMLFIYLILIATIHAAIIGGSIISKEEEDKTAEFLFAKPVSRITVITSKLLAAFTNILVMNIVTLISSIAFVGHYSKGEYVTGDILKLLIGMFMLQLIFMVLGTGIAAISKNPKTAIPATTGVLLITFILSLIVDINSKLENLKYFTPFKYFEAKNLLFGKGFEPIYIILSLIIIVVLLISTYIFYEKRDLSV